MFYKWNAFKWKFKSKKIQNVKWNIHWYIFFSSFKILNFEITMWVLNLKYDCFIWRFHILMWQKYVEFSNYNATTKTSPKEQSNLVQTPWNLQFLQSLVAPKPFCRKNRYSKKPRQQLAIFDISKSMISHIKFKDKFGIRSQSNCSKVVFMKQFFLSKQKHFQSFCVFIKKVYSCKKFSSHNILWDFFYTFPSPQMKWENI